jgi:hypothetical protein
VSTPELHLQTLFVLDDERRIVCAREPGGPAGPLFSLVRGPTSCVWAVRVDVAAEAAAELDALARQEPPVSDSRNEPVHADRYASLLSDLVRSRYSGPAFAFRDVPTLDGDVVPVDDERLLAHHFAGWTPGEIAAGRAPVMAVVVEGRPVSICFCARRSDVAAEAGVETAAPFRGRGFAPRVTAAWALAVRASGRIPLYSTAWTNDASLAVARKLGLVAYACGWNLGDGSGS